MFFHCGLQLSFLRTCSASPYTFGKVMTFWFEYWVAILTRSFFQGNASRNGEHQLHVYELPAEQADHPQVPEPSPARGQGAVHVRLDRRHRRAAQGQDQDTGLRAQESGRSVIPFFSFQLFIQGVSEFMIQRDKHKTSWQPMVGTTLALALHTSSFLSLFVGFIWLFCARYLRKFS